jgi:hypothetical protein
VAGWYGCVQTLNEQAKTERGAVERLSKELEALKVGHAQQQQQPTPMVSTTRHAQCSTQVYGPCGHIVAGGRAAGSILKYDL